MNMEDVEGQASSLSHGRNTEARDVSSTFSCKGICNWFLLHSHRSTGELQQSSENGSQGNMGPPKIKGILVILFLLVPMFLDYIFLYVPLVNYDKKCIELDKSVGITVAVLRSVIDLVYGCNFISEFLSSSDLSDRSSSDKSSWRYILYIAALLPLPQVIILSHLPEMIFSRSFNITDLLKLVILIQYLPRICMISPLLMKQTDATMVPAGSAKDAWVIAALSFSFYILCSHIFGALWYLLSIGRVTRCWQKACTNIPGCVRRSFYCDVHSEDNTYIIDACPIELPDAAIFDFGIYLDALKSGIVSSKDFPGKLSYCFWWGLQNLSSLGQSLQTSTYFWEILFAVSISIFGLAGLLLFIGNVQTYLESKTARVAEKRQQSVDAKTKEKIKEKMEKQMERFLTSYKFTDDLKSSISRHLMNKYTEDDNTSTKIFNLSNLIDNLPFDLQKNTKRFFTRHLLLMLPYLKDATEEILDELCLHLKPVVVDEYYYFAREGESLDKMIFVIRGKLRTMTSKGEMNDSYIYGENLITWILESPYSTNFPKSDKTVQASDNVEAFILMANDLRNIITLKFWQPLAASVTSLWLGKKANTVLGLLTPNLKQQIKQCLQSSLEELPDYDVGTLLSKLPTDLNRPVKRHLCLGPLKNVPLFMNMDDKWLDQLCDYLRPVHYTDRSHIIREGEPIVEMVFLVQGKLWGYSTSEAKNQYFSDGSCYGEELVNWAEAGSTAKLPTATITIQACSDVEAFTLPAGVLKLLVWQQNMDKKPFTTKAAFSRFKRKGYGSKNDEDSPSKIINDFQTEDISDSQTGTSSQDNLPVFAESKSKEIESDAEQDP